MTTSHKQPPWFCILGVNLQEVDYSLKKKKELYCWEEIGTFCAQDKSAETNVEMEIIYLIRVRII